MSRDTGTVDMVKPTLVVAGKTKSIPS